MVRAVPSMQRSRLRWPAPSQSRRSPLGLPVGLASCAQGLEAQPPVGRSIPRGYRRDGHARGLPGRCLAPGVLLGGLFGGVLRPGNRLNMRSRGKQPRRADLKALGRGSGVHRCVSDHILGRSSEVEKGVGSRQSVGRPSPVGKDPLTGCAWWRSDGCSNPCCRQTPTTDFAITGMVRPI